uniref:Uncharacterized protein n=1 Tax=Caenorhabditis japonica TaxID=281687 RepID=A0A8R1IGZ3_CAEJA
MRGTSLISSSFIRSPIAGQVGARVLTSVVLTIGPLLSMLTEVEQSKCARSADGLQWKIATLRNNSADTVGERERQAS